MLTYRIQFGMLLWGWHTDDILSKIEPWSTTHQPDAVLIHPTSNDIFQGLSIQSSTDELTEIVHLLHRANCEVIVLDVSSMVLRVVEYEAE